MSISLTGTGGFFTRQGQFIGAYNYVSALYGSSITSDFLGIWGQFATADQQAVENLPTAVETFRQSGVTYGAVLAADGSLAAQLQANRDASLVPFSLTTALQRVRQQMIDTAQSIDRPTVGSSTSADGDNDGDTNFYASTTNVFGDPLDMTVAEALTATCISQGSGFQAAFTLVGPASVTPNSWDWPQGSGTSTSLSVFDPAVDGIVTNGGFSAFTVANTPDGWTIVNGSAGVTVFQGVGDGVRAGTDAVYIQSDGSQATKIAQELTLSINTVYAVTFQAKMNANSASGTLVVQLVNGDTGAVLQNDAGSNLQVSYALNGGGGEITTSYQQFTVFFSTPRQLPDSVQIRAGYGTAGVSTRELYLDLVGITIPTALYGLTGTGTYGPYVVAVADTLPSAAGDVYTVTFTNDVVTQSFVQGLERLYGMRNLGVYLPSSGSPTISDSLVTH